MVSDSARQFWGGKDEEQTGQDSLDYLKFMCKPEVIKMNLEILYKSVPFLSKEKINSSLESYKQSKK